MEKNKIFGFMGKILQVDLSDKRLREIGLSDIAEDLSRNGKITGRECPSIDELLVKDK